MDYSKLTLLNMMQTRMAYLAERQDHLARNVANTNTPGYNPRDLKKLDFAKLAQIESRRLNLRATQPSHIPQPPQKPEQFREQKMRKTHETTPVKNKVALEEQMMLVAKTNLDYQTTLNVYKKTSDLFRTAIGNN